MLPRTDFFEKIEYTIIYIGDFSSDELSRYYELVNKVRNLSAKSQNCHQRHKSQHFIDDISGSIRVTDVGDKMYLQEL